MDSLTPTLLMCLLYIVLGTIAILANILNIFIFLINKEMRKKYVIFIALDVGELINGLSYVLTAIGRGSSLLDGTFGVPITVHECFFERYWVHSLIVGTELPALVTTAISIERILAVRRPIFYKRVATMKTRILILVVVTFIQLGFLSTAAISAYHNVTEHKTRQCFIITSTASFFSTFHFSFVILAYVISFVSLLITFVFHKKLHKNSNGAKADHHLGLSLSVTGCSIVLVAMPSAVMMGLKWEWFVINDLGIGFCYATTGFLSVATTILNFIYRDEYRSQLKSVFRLNTKQKTKVENFVSPMPAFPKWKNKVAAGKGMYPVM
ncbi:hypothetical protein QR680_013896 [Steinernema hermaphroditum]|uniref:G-protein coupled receptors family 1 profile domain-containing protein n=1 Tax=Steinernema hermaphroditum TaxID=289476 RepID=A0AA39M353_9BILA|nr:hypothetical protein QR680_013896 [Steinernema hermaphroditum]